MTTVIIISILLIGAVSFWAGFKIGYSKNRKIISSAIDSWKANYLYKNNFTQPGTFIYHENDISWETDTTFNKNTYDFRSNIDFSELNWCNKGSIDIIKEKMKKALEIEDYEKAAEYRDLLKSLDKSDTN